MSRLSFLPSRKLVKQILLLLLEILAVSVSATLLVAQDAPGIPANLTAQKVSNGVRSRWSDRVVANVGPVDFGTAEKPAATPIPPTNTPALAASERHADTENHPADRHSRRGPTALDRCPITQCAVRSGGDRYKYGDARCAVPTAG